MRRACWLLPRPHICRGKAGDKLEAGTPWHPAGPAQPCTGHISATRAPRCPQHGTEWHRAPAWPGQPPRASLPCSPRAKHSLAQHSLAQPGTERTHPQQPRVPPGCPAGPHPPQPRCPPWGRPPPPLPVALWGRGTPQPGTLPPHGVSSTGTPRWCNGDSLALVQDAAAHTWGVQRAVPEGHTSPCVYRRGHPHRGLQVPRSRALPRAVPCMPPPGCACPTAVTCLELDGPQHLCHIVHIDGEVVHVLVARLWAAAHRHLGHVCDPAGQTDALGSCQAPAATAPCPATAPSPQPPAPCPQPHSLLQELLGVLWRKAGDHQCHWSNGTRGPGKQVPPPPAPRFFQVTAAPSAQLRGSPSPTEDPGPMAPPPSPGTAPTPS